MGSVRTRLTFHVDGEDAIRGGQHAIIGNAFDRSGKCAAYRRDGPGRAIIRRY